MNFYTRKPNSVEFGGPLSLEEIRSRIEAGSLPLSDEVIEATGQTYSALKKSTEWTTISERWPQAEFTSSNAPPSCPAKVDYFIKARGEEKGPYAESQLRSMWNNGIITSDTVIRENDKQDWQPISKLFEADKPACIPLSDQLSKPISKSLGSESRKSQAGTLVFLGILLVVIAIMALGNIHVITGGSLESPRIVRKESFGLSETFVNINTITHMPWFAAKSRYPLSCTVLMREGLIESDADFKTRQEQEIKEDIRKALQNLSQ